MISPFRREKGLVAGELTLESREIMDAVAVLLAAHFFLARGCAAVSIQCRKNEGIRMDGGAQLGRSSADRNQADIN